MNVIDNSKNTQLNLVYTDSEKNKWYSHINPLEISPIRGLSAEKAKRFMEMKITEKSLKALILEIKVAAGQNDIVKAFSIIEEINHRLNFITEEDSILDLVLIYYFLEDENPNVPSEYHNDKKRKILIKDPKARGFFLQIGISLMKQFSSIPEENLNEYLIKTKDLADRIYRYISRTNPNDMTSS